MLGFSLAVALAFANGSSVSTNGNGTTVIIMPAKWIKPVNSALADFRKSRANWKCFQVVITPRSDGLRIGFSSKPRTSKDPGTGAISIGPQKICGRGASYLVTEDGRILKRLRVE